MMKKTLLFISIFILGLVLYGCGSNDNENIASSNEKVFTQEDIEKVEEMVGFLDERMLDFEKQANENIQSKEIKVGNNEEFSNSVKELAQKTVIEPFLEKYPGSLVAPTSQTIPVTFESSSSEPCGFGNCNYDKVNVLQVEYNLENNEIYKSKEFSNSQLIFNDIQMKYEDQPEEEKEESSMSFVKSTDGKLIFSRNPFLHVETIDFQELDKEFESIATDVPESEIEAEQADYKEEVEETLAKFPKLQ
ncbi:MAG: hypothetical protein WBF39_14810 [Planococcus donghaensis]